MRIWPVAAIAVLAAVFLGWHLLQKRARSTEIAGPGATPESNARQLDKNRALIALSENPNTRFWKTDFDELTEAEQVFVAIWELEAEVNNGGFEQYYYNSSGDTAYFVVEALERVGALQMAAIVRQANAGFAEGGPSRSRPERQKQLAALPNQVKGLLDELTDRFFDYPDNLTELLYAFIREHRHEIQGASDF